MIFGLMLNEFDSKLLTAAFQYFHEVLDIHEVDIPIELRLVDNIGKGKTGGTCKPIYNSDLELTKVKIEIKQGITVFGMIEALAHEMVHAKQFIKGQTTIRVEKDYIFGFIPYNKLIKLWNGVDVTRLSYYNQPAEQEAHLLQRKLTVDFLNANKQFLEPDYITNLFIQATESKGDC